MLVPRRFIRRGGVLLAAVVVWALLMANRAVIPWGKPSWAAGLGEAGAAVDRDFSRQHNERPGNLTLHIVAHSHSDIGWNYSFGQYYRSWVRQVLRNVVTALWMDRARKFTWGDIAFLDMWMDDEGDRTNGVLPGRAAELTWRAALGELIGRGQWEIVGGTYVSPDEGLTTWWAHNAIVDVGRRFVARELNTTTRVGWQVDPFGHAHVTPHLLANAGFGALLMGRMDYRTRFDFAAHGDYEFLWQAPYSQAPPLLTHYLSKGYAAPSAHFDFDNTATCNAAALLDELVRFARTQTRQYPGHGHVLVMMGDDFRYANASWAFACLDRIVDEARSLQSRTHAWRDMTLQYSTPSEYLAAIRPHLAQIDKRLTFNEHKERRKGGSGQRQLRLHRGDFYPYQDKPYEQYWSGLYTSRPALKRLVRSAEQAVQHVEALVAMARVRQSRFGRDDKEAAAAEWDVLERGLEYSRKQVAIGYHHDAVTGTCSRSAAEDYELRLRAARRVAMHIGQHALRLSLAESNGSAAGQMEREIEDAKTVEKAAPGYNTADISDDDDNDNNSHLTVTDVAQPAVIAVTNAHHLSAQNQTVRLRVPTLDVALVDAATRRAVGAVAVRPALDGSGFVVDFVARNVPPLGWRYFVLANETAALRKYGNVAMLRDARSAVVSSGPLLAKAELEKDGMRVRLTLDRDGSAVRMAIQRGTGHSEVVVHQLRQYFVNPRVQSSGAYIMHSFMLMYAIVFYVFGGGLCAGLCGAVVVATRRRRIQPNKAAAARSPLVALALGASVGIALVYYVEQVASIAALNRWAGGSALSSAGLAAVALAVGYASATVLGARARLCVFFIYGTAAAVVAVLFGAPTWQSRPLAVDGARIGGFRVETGGAVCDTASVDVGNSASVVYRLCAGRSNVVEVSVRVEAETDREIVAHFVLPDGGMLPRQCAFDMFDGVGVVRRQYQRWTPVPGNYYPAVSHVALASGRLALHSRQATGATCVAAKTLEVGMHRSLSANDYRGLNQPLVDNSVASVTHFVDIGDAAFSAHSGPLANVAINAPALAFLMTAPGDGDVTGPAIDALLVEHSGLGAAGEDATGAVGLGCVRFVGIQHQRQQSNSSSSGNSLDIYARVQLLLGDPRCMDEHGAGIINLPGLLAIGPQQRADVYTTEFGDWTIGEWQHQRTERMISSHARLLPGEQALYRFSIAPR
ncbi:mannosyl-oligosaccharide 1,3-1,6-alpha-mannosidase activity protein [Coemansia sp. RSA 1200]|nr:mannosyl-oligosaccharide 1,3-1,6-alpha-mannosidase activity protein [Coemansia sp. RSA 1200]